MADTKETAFGSWTHENLETQGYHLTDAERRALWLGLRFSTGLCLGLVAAALVLQSAVMFAVLSVIGLVAGFTQRHPFDYFWNHALRQVFDAPALPPNPPRRRHSFKVGTAWLLAIVLLFAVGLDTAGLVMGAVLVAVCGLLTVTNFCIPSTMLAWWEERHARRAVSA